MRAVRVAALSLLALLACAATALAVLPQKSAKFSGRGTIYFNDAPHWNKVPRTKEAFSFTTSSNGRTMLNFRGAYAYYCGAGTATVTAHTLSVSSKGRFRYDFWIPSHGPNGKVNGRVYVSIYGSFLAGGSKADVNYLFDFVSTGQSVKHPYTPGDGRGLGCASWVRGVATVR